ncbi:unnamed protein product [Mesocestoides corti]|uniref:RT_RNaseH_2 domain-containing protein n=1 Tax=Mesocestoides corti TaxID=53468 RepID=A0A0R3UM37_MESCO|nr:unnamed protein product [Mesocestoides corti]
MFPILDPKAPPFILDTDASSPAIGAVLSQRGTNGAEHVIAYASMALDKSEWNYSTTRRESLAIVAFTKSLPCTWKGNLCDPIRPSGSHLG